MSTQQDDSIGYVRKEIPQVEIPDYAGKRYETRVPDTLDLAERAALGIVGLTGPTDPEADYELYWRVVLRHNPPMMYHDWNDHVQVKFMEALPLLRLISGSDLNQDVEQRWMEVMLHMQGPDGLLYWPKVGRPWASDFEAPLPHGDHYTVPYDDGRLLGAMTIYYSLTGEEVWKHAAKRVVQGLLRLLVDRGTDAYFPKIQFGLHESPDPGTPMLSPIEASWAGWTIMGLAQFFRATGYEPAARLAQKLSRFLKDSSGAFGAHGEYEGYIHFHHHSYPLLGMLEHALAIGDQELVEFVCMGYEFGKARGEPLIGYFPENIHTAGFQTSEICEVADMIALGVKLAEWDDVDRWVRNQFAEGQLMGTDWIYRMIEGMPFSPIDETSQTAENVPERNVGAFAGWPSANDWLGQGPGIMHCCTGNAARTLYYVWENTLHYDHGRLKVNLLLNRASPWGDVDSHIPYTGQVDVKVKQACALSIRIPEWVMHQGVRCRVSGSDRTLDWDGRYACVGAVMPGDVVTMTFPIEIQSDSVCIEGQRYTLVRKGNDVVYVDPPGQYCPLYQRAHYRENLTRWRKITRFVVHTLLPW